MITFDGLVSEAGIGADRAIAIDPFRDGAPGHSGAVFLGQQVGDLGLGMAEVVVGDGLHNQPRWVFDFADGG